MGVSIGKEPRGPVNAAWPAAAELFGRWLTLCDELSEFGRDEWVLTPLAQVRMKSNSRWRCRHFDRDKLIIAIRPGGNETVWEYAVRPPARVSMMMVGTIASLWNGWTGHGVPPAYAANRSDEAALAESDARNAAAVHTERPDEASGTASPSVVDILGAIQARAREADELRAGIREREARRDKVIADAEVLFKEADKLDREVVAMRTRLDSPELVQAMAAIKAFSGLLGFNTGGST